MYYMRSARKNKNVLRFSCTEANEQKYTRYKVREKNSSVRHYAEAQIRKAEDTA